MNGYLEGKECTMYLRLCMYFDGVAMIDGFGAADRGFEGQKIRAFFGWEKGSVPNALSYLSANFYRIKSAFFSLGKLF